jgi:outer membrane receptor protein involved in Fe transport
MGSALVNDVRFGYNRVAIGVFPENPHINNAAVGLKPLATNPRDDGLSFTTVAGYSALGQEYNNPQASASDTFQLRDTATWALRGGHLFKVGGEWYGVRQSAYRDVQARASSPSSIRLHGQCPGGPPARPSVLTGGARLDNPQNLRAQSWSLFAHDDWRVRPSLTVSAGLRYDYMSPPVDADDRATARRSDRTTRRRGQQRMPRGGYDPDRNLAPAPDRLTLDKALERCCGRLRHLLQPGRWPRPKG